MTNNFNSFKINISPASSVPLAGYANRTKKSSGSAAPLEANGLLIKSGDEIDLIIISLDALFPSEALKRLTIQILSKKYQISLQVIQLAFVASHSHYAPSLDPKKPQLGEVDEDHLHFVASLIATKIHAHINHKANTYQQAKYASAICNKNIYRRKPNAPCAFILSKRFPFVQKIKSLPNKSHEIQQELQLLKLYNASGDVFCVLWSWPCHAVSSPDHYRISPDFPGFVRTSLREIFNNNDLSILYFPGFCGDIRPNFTTKKMSLFQRLRMPLFFGERFAKNTQNNFNQLCLSLKEAIIKSEEQSVAVNINNFKNSSSAPISISKLIENFEGDYKSIPTLKFELGDICFLFIGAEVCNDYYKLLKVDNKINFFSGYFDECFGYLPSDTQIPKGGYEVEGFMQPFGLKGKFKTYIQKHIIAACNK